MPTRAHSDLPGLKELITGILTLLEWQEQLAREALARMDDDTDRPRCPAEPNRPPPRPPQPPRAGRPG